MIRRSSDGRSVYCIQPHTQFYEGSVNGIVDTDTMISMSNLSSQQIERIKLISYYGYEFGSSALLQSGSSREYSLTFMISGSGTMYGGYQHAVSSVTLNESKDYSISSSGLGNVLKFPASVRDKYDGMRLSDK